MSISVSKELAHVKDLINEGKYEEAFQLVKDLEQKENLTSEETLRTQVYQCRIYFALGQSDVALKIAEDLYQKSQEMKMPLFSLDALFLKEYVYMNLWRIEELFIILEQHEKLFKSIPREESLEFQEREAYLFLMKGSVIYLEGKLDLAINYHRKSLTLFEQIDSHSYIIPTVLFALAWDYQQKGELNLALECNEKSLSLIPKGEY